MKASKTDFSLLRPKLLLEEEGIKAWFTLKNKDFGSSEYNIPGLNLGFNTSEKREIIARNRLVLLSSLSIDKDWVAYADQVHSNRVRVVNQGGTYPSTDGLITQIPGLTLGIQVADCAAVLIWDAKNKVISALHAGWRGAVGDIVPKGTEMMVGLGADPRQMRAFISPCLSLNNFEVGDEVADQFPQNFVDYENFEKPHVDLKGFIKHQLAQAGVPESHIEVREECTIEQSGDLYSYRREGHKSGRMMGLIRIDS